MDIFELLGSYSVEIILGLGVAVIVLLILFIINVVQMAKLKKRYSIFMEGNTAKNLENTLIKRLDQVDALIEANNANEKDIRTLFSNMKFAFQKAGLVKYDAFNELGGKLSFSLALLNETNDGYMFNTVHSREGCYIYMKEIIKGNSIIMLTDEEKQALDIAMGNIKKSADE